MGAFAKSCDAVAKRRARQRACAVMEAEITTGGNQALGHAKQRGDADAACQQQAVWRRDQWEVVARRTDREGIACTDLVMQRDGAAPRRRIAQHGDAIAVGFLVVVAQGVLAHQSTGQVHVDVRTRAEGGQGRAVGTGEFVAEDALGFFLAPQHLHLNVGHVSEAAGFGDFSAATRRSMTRRDCTPPASISSIRRRRCGCCRRLRCCASST